jgi:hypothetical protein
MTVTTFITFGGLEPNSLRLTIAFTALGLFLRGAIAMHFHLGNYRLVVPPLYALGILPFNRGLKPLFHYLGISEALYHVCNLSVWVLPYLPGYEFPFPFGMAAFASWQSLTPLGN